MQKDIIRSLWKQILALAVVGIIIIAVVVPYIFKEITIKEAALVAQNTAQQYSQLRSYYTKNIVTRLKSSGNVSISSDYKKHKNGIPLPATMIHELSELSNASGLQIKLYSAYPFPERSDRVLDAFQQQAWQQLSNDPDTPYLESLNINGSEVVRVAIADKLTATACVDCHNSHPDTPKDDWEIGDLRGVLEVVVPIDQQLSWQQGGSYQLSVIFVLVFLVIFLTLLSILKKESAKQLGSVLIPLKNQKFAMNAHSLVSMADKQGKITYVNDKFCEISGYEKIELLGKKHSLLNSGQQSQTYWKEMHKQVLAGEVWHDEVRNKTKDGHYYWVDTTIVPNFDRHNKVNGFTSIRTDITSKKKAAEILTEAIKQAQADAAELLVAKEQAQAAKFALDQHSLISMADINGTITYVNDKFVEISGYPASEIIGNKHSLLNSGNQPKGYWKGMHQQVLSGSVWHDEVRNRAKGGEYYWVDTTIVPNFDAAGKVIGFTSIRTDITAQKENIVNLEFAKQQAESAKFALDQHSLVSVANLNGTITYVNQKFVDISGYQSSELVGQKHSLLNSGHQPKDYWKDMHQQVLDGNVWHDEVRNRAKDGSYYWVDTTIVPNVDVANKVIGFTSIRTDISEQKNNIEKLIMAKEQAQAANFALDQHSLVSVADLKGTITYVNEKFVAISGYSADELIGNRHNLLNSGNQRKAYWKDMHQTVLGGKVWHDEVRNRSKDGHFYWVDTTIVPNLDAAGAVIGFTSIRTDITEQKENLYRLDYARKQAESAKFALDQHSLVSVADLKGNITYVNEKFIEISGYDEAEIIGQKHSLLNSGKQKKGYWKAMHEKVLAGETWHDEVRNRAKGGHYYWVDTTIVPNLNEDSEVVGFTSIRTDVTQQVLNLEKLEIAKEQAEVASNTKAEFLANMSHEIRTPMNGVIGMTNLLLNTNLSREQDKLANTVKASAAGLLGIINDILDFSKVEAGKLDLELIPFNLGQMVEDVGKAMSFQADSKSLHFICPANPIIQQWVKADPGRIRQVLTNLIGNAIKFTEEGEVAVFVKLLAQNTDQKIFRFEIRDTGIGISEQQQLQLFDKFTQADTSTTRKYGGTGLGLSICQQLIGLMDGEIGIESSVGRGTTFWFELPLLKTKALIDPPFYNTNITNERILIVDDNDTNRDLMRQLHDVWEIPHTLVDSARAALAELTLAALEKRPYTIAILDMHMPNTSGLELCKQIRAIPQLISTKLVMASSQAQRGDAAKMKKAGFKGYLTKPIHQSELFDVLLMVSGLKSEDPEFITRHSTKEHIKFKAHILVVEDNPTNQLVIEGLLRTLGVTVDIAGNGEEALAALQHRTDHDLVFMDCQMPVLDGYEATKKIRSEHSGIIKSDIPIIAMTANAMAGDKQKCLDCGMDDYLSKPVVYAKVIDMLDKWLPEAAKPQAIEDAEIVEQSPVKSESRADEIVVFDYDDMAGRLMGDIDLMRSVAEIFYEDLVEQLTTLKECVGNGDMAKSAAVIHQIKGAAANVGGKSLSALAHKMETEAKANKNEELHQDVARLEQQFSTLKLAMEKALA